MTKKPRYQLSQAAQHDLIAIRKHGRRQFGFAQSQAYIAGLIRILDIIADNPQLGRLRLELTPPARVHPHGSHVLIYVLDRNSRPLIIRIRDARESWIEDLSGRP